MARSKDLEAGSIDAERRPAVDPVRTQAERRETAERAILEAAKQIAAERGLNELTLTEAGEAAGYSRALPAHYFGNRHALVSALADHILATYAQRSREAFAPGDGLPELLMRVGFYIDDCVRDPTGLKAFFAILAASPTHPEMHALVQRLNRESIDGLAAIIRNARDKGEIRADARPRAEASIILASIRGVMFQWLIDPTHVNPATVRDALLANIRASLAP